MYVFWCCRVLNGILSVVLDSWACLHPDYGKSVCSSSNHGVFEENEID